MSSLSGNGISLSFKIFITCDCQALKQEARCGASRTNDGNLNKKLPCNEECARLERNRRLAVALNIDQSTHVDGGDHIPYSEEVLDLFQQHSQWAQAQEREFRVFGESPDEKRFRFKPMTAQQRAFIHALADDFGFDSESMDPEPHRHVLLLKTPRFVSSPNKTIAECVRIRTAQRLLLVAQPAVEKGRQAHSTAINGEPWNAFIITNPRFGLTEEEVGSAIASQDLPAGPTLDISFLPSHEVVLKPTIPPSESLTETDLSEQLKKMKSRLGAAIETNGIGTVYLCTVDSSLNVTSRETDSASIDGWSRVAAKGAAPRQVQPNVPRSSMNTFSALGGQSGRVTFTKKKDKKPPPVEVVDDWEAEMEADEDRNANAEATSVHDGIDAVPSPSADGGAA
ncbi:hypothetical protein ANO11243_043540 [Dothideomycetidae sp. 11243]|nr:hypothetical protein ANO11243_043540 [fungal sp. No.11243]